MSWSQEDTTFLIANIFYVICEVCVQLEIKINVEIRNTYNSKSIGILLLMK
jgi:hypothetical protein